MGAVGGAAAGMYLGGPVGAYLGGQAGKFLGGKIGGLFGSSPKPDPNAYDLRRALEAAAQGKTPSAAEAQMRQAMGRATNQQFALARSTPGLAPGAALRQASIGAAAASQDIAGQAAALRAQEQAQARGQLANYSLGQQQQQLQRDQYDRQGWGAVLGGLSSMGAQYATSKGGGGGSALNVQGGYGTVPSASGGVRQQIDPEDPRPMSDERAKTGIGDGDDEAEALLEALRAATYRYRDPGAPGAAPGPQLGVMAQDVERAAPGMVGRDDAGMRRLDGDRSLGPILAALANLHGRVRAQEGRA